MRLQDGRVYQGAVEDVDVKSDLATVRINAKNLPKMKLGTSKDTRPGEWVSLASHWSILLILSSYRSILLMFSSHWSILLILSSDWSLLLRLSSH